MESKPVSAMGRAIERLKVKKYIAAFKPYKCSECNDVFTNRSQLNGHLTFVHKGKKTYDCNIYDKISSVRLSVHETMKTNKCNVCEKYFSKKHHLTRHIAAVHEGIKPHKCNVCEKHFSTKPHAQIVYFLYLIYVR